MRGLYRMFSGLYQKFTMQSLYSIEEDNTRKMVTVSNYSNPRDIICSVLIGTSEELMWMGKMHGSTVLISTYWLSVLQNLYRMENVSWEESKKIILDISEPNLCEKKC